MYQVGEKIIYGSNGVCLIEEIKMIMAPKSDEEKAYYIIKPMFQECRISVPVDTKMFMRPIISEEEALALIERIFACYSSWNSYLTQDFDDEEKAVLSRLMLRIAKRAEQYVKGGEDSCEPSEDM